MTITFANFKKRVASSINQTDSAGNFISAFALSNELLRYTNDGLREKVELLGVKMRYMYLQYGYIDLELDQAYYRIDTGDSAANRYLLSHLYVKWNTTDTDYTPTNMVTLDDLESGRLIGTAGSPLWAYAQTDAGDGINHLGIKLSPTPSSNATEGIMIAYPEYPVEITGDADLIYFHSQSELEWLTYYVAMKTAIKSKDAESYQVLKTEFQIKEQQLITQFAPRALTGTQPIRSLRQASRSILKSKGLI